jgi:ferritin-like metal-binding protein YciE
MKSESLRELYVNELHHLYRTKVKLVSILPRMVKSALSPSVKAELKDELKLARGHLGYLVPILEALGERPKRSSSGELTGALARARVTLVHGVPSPSMDTALITTTQRIVRDNIAGYSCVRTYARLLYFDDAARQLQYSLNDEGAADERLRQLARSAFKIRFNATEVTV